jgi:hypothetical protein
MLVLWDAEQAVTQQQQLDRRHRPAGERGAGGGGLPGARPRAAGFTRYSSFGKGGEGEADGVEEDRRAGYVPASLDCDDLSLNLVELCGVKRKKDRNIADKQVLWSSR